VHSDADLDYAVQKCIAGGFAQAGQSCISVQRILVHEPVYAAFEKKLLEGVARIKTGDPKDPQTVVGPVIDASNADRLLSWISEAKAAGAKILAGGTKEGNVVQPTVVQEARADLKVSARRPSARWSRWVATGPSRRRCGSPTTPAYGLQAGIFTHDIRSSVTRPQPQCRRVMVNEVPTMRVDSMPTAARGTRASAAKGRGTPCTKCRSRGW